MKLLHDLGALVLWVNMLLMTAPFSVPVALAEEERPTNQDVGGTRSNEDPKVLVEPYLSEKGIKVYRERLNKIGSMTPEELTRFRIDYFSLYVNCEPVAIIVEELSDDANRIGLTEQSIVAAVESRLRAARIYTDTGSTPYLHIVLTVVRNAFSIKIALNKRLFDDTNSMRHGIAATWLEGMTGTASNHAFILGGVSELMDLFIADYLRINEIACKYKEK